MLYVSPKRGFKRFTLKVSGKKGGKGKVASSRRSATKNYAAAASRRQGDRLDRGLAERRSS